MVWISLGLFKANLGFRWFDFQRKVGKWEGPLVLVKRNVAHDAVSVGEDFVGKPLDRFVVGAGDEQENILKQDADLDDELKDFKYNKEKDGVKEADGNIRAFQEKGFHGAHELSSFL
jgi:hypothetical protein